MMNRQLQIGWAQTDITPDRPVYVIGQLYSWISSYVHDPITATCLGAVQPVTRIPLTLFVFPKTT